MENNFIQMIIYTIGTIFILVLTFLLKHKLNLTYQEAEKKADYYISYLFIIILLVVTISLTVIYS